MFNYQENYKTRHDYRLKSALMQCIFFSALIFPRKRANLFMKKDNHELLDILKDMTLQNDSNRFFGTKKNSYGINKPICHL